MDIVFVNGLVKSREKYLIERRTFLQAAESESFSDAVKILKDSGFGDSSEGAASSYEEIVSSEWNKFFDFLKKYSPKDWFLKGVAAKYDFFNAEYALREKYAGASEKGYLEEGLVKVSDIKAYLKDGKGEIPEAIKRVIEKGKAEFEGGNATGKSVSVLFKRAYYEYMLKVVKSKDWKEFIVHEIDALNLSVALRAGSEKEAESEY
ncbi:MAG: V-type ATPase subunit, partial [Clostridia bacterium]|nr:V-type ATPase subunit [Clostridia bacterium]